MGRDITFNFRRGGGAAMEVLWGTVSLTPTAVHENGTATVLSAPTTVDLVSGQATIPGVAETPADDSWIYQVRVETRGGRFWDFYVGVPTGTTAIPFTDLPTYAEASANPLKVTGPVGPQGPKGDVGHGFSTTTVSDSVDFNTLRTPGTYLFRLSTVVSGSTNTPNYPGFTSGVAGYLLVEGDGSTLVKQTWSNYNNTSETLSRSLYSGAWYAWAPLVENATATQSGLMLAADKLKLDNAVSAPTASRLAIRDTAGRLQIASPSAVGDAATKAYVDDAVSGKVNSTDIANGIRSDILKGHGEIIGDDGKRYGFVGGTIRNDSDAWYSHENTTHAAVGTTTVSTDTTQITIGYPGRGHVKAVTLIAGPDETLATAGISVGASVANHQALIRLGGEVKYAGLIQYDGTDFVVTGGNGATASWDATNSIVVVGHGVLPTVDNAGAHDVQVTSRGDVRSFIAASRAITRGSFGVGFRSAGGVALTDPSTQMRFTFRHSTAARLNPQAVNTGLFPNSNIWYFGVFEL